MTKKRSRKFVALLLALSLCSSGLFAAPKATAAERPTASKVASGHLLIGTYLIQKEALTKPVLDAAKSSSDQSDQGMFYKSEFAAGTWFNIKNGFDLSAILNPSGSPVTNAEIDKLKVTIWVRIEAGKQKIEWLETPAELDRQIAELKELQSKAEEDNKKAVEAKDDTLALQLSIKAASLKAQVDFLQALKAGDSDGAAEELDKLANPEKLLESAVKGAQADLQKKLEADLAQVEADLQAAKNSGDLAAVKKLLAQRQKAEDDLLAFKKAVLATELEKAIAGSMQLAQDLNEAINTSQSKRAKELLEKLDEVDKTTKLFQHALLTLQVTALEKRLREASSAEEIETLKGKIAEVKEASLAEEKKRLQAESKLIEVGFQSAEKLAQKELAALLLAKLNTMAARVQEIQTARKEGRVTALHAQVARIKAEIAAAKAKGAAELADQLLIPLVQAEAELAAEEQALVDLIFQIEEAKLKLIDKLKRATSEEAALLNQELTVLEGKLLGAQKEKLFVEKERAEQKQKEVQLETGGVKSASLQELHKEAIQRIQQIEKQKYTPEELELLQSLQKQIQSEQPKATVLPVDHLIAKRVDIKFMMPPLILEDRTLIHIRPISESFGSAAKWNQEEQSVTITKEGTTVYCKIGAKTALVDGREVKLDTPPRLIAGRTVVPLRFVMEALGLDVAWDGPTQTVEIKGGISR